MPRLIYTFFIRYNDFGAPSFSKFARSIGTTSAELVRWREHKEFDRAYRECSEIKRDYLIDSALTRKFDPSLVKYILSSDFNGDGEDAVIPDEIKVTLEVIGE